MLPLRRETESGVAVTERNRERDESERVWTQLRAKPTPPRETRSTCRRCRRLPLPDLPSPASSLHSSQVFTLELLSFPSNFKTLWSENQRNCACALWTWLVVFHVCVFTDEWIVMNWTDLVIVNWICAAATACGVFFFFGFLVFWLCDSVFVTLALYR